ncbi:MAG: Stf0 family sulfotransferase [Candidatus Rokuibacteriota bacterium]
MRVSLCVVVRNLAGFVGPCIASARPVVDEVVVVDTGSSDGTPEIARAAGAVVIETAWPGDLARAHDLPVARARGDWVLVLDGDEVLDPATRPEVRRLVDTREYEGYLFTVRNYVYAPALKWRPADPRSPLSRGAAGYTPSTAVRLFRRRGYQHRGLVHQSVAPAIQERGGRIGEAPVPIHHYGFLRIDPGKEPLYLALQRRQVAAAPSSASAWLELGVLLFRAHRLPAALDAFRRARRLGLRAAASFFIGQILIRLGRPDAAERFLRAAIRSNPRDTSVDFDLADAWEALAQACEDRGLRRRAGRAYERALAIRADSPVALNDLAGLLAESGAARRAARLVARLLARQPGLAMAWATLGTSRFRRDDLTGARRALETALAIDPLCLPARTNLAVTHARAGRSRAATTAFVAARSLMVSPVRGVGGLRPARPANPLIAARPKPLRRRGVVSMIPHLGGGGGRVLVDTIRVLPDRPHLVLCGATDDYVGMGLGAELRALGVPVRTIATEDDVRAILEEARPGSVIHHWWPNRITFGPVRTGRERWIAYGHSAFAMPFGYDAYVTLSDFHRRFQSHLPPERLHQIPNAVDRSRFRPRGQGRDRPVTIAVLSRLDPGKFPRRLLDHLPPPDGLGARVLIAGRGARRYEIEADIAARGLQGIVRFVGVLPSDRVPEFLAEADIGLHLTETAEECGSVAVIEMLASGLPVVSQPRGCLPEMVRPGLNGFLGADEGTIARDLARLISSPALRRRMGAASRRISARHDIRCFRAAVRRLVTGDPGNRVVPAPRRPFRSGLSAWSPRIAYLVCATPRSGGGFLCEVLRQTGLAGVPDDYFSAAAVRRLAERAGVEDFAGYLRWVLEEGSTPNGVFGAMLGQSDLAGLGRRLGLVRETPPREVAARLAAALPGLRYVRVIPGEGVRQVMSGARAAAAGRRPRPRLGHDGALIARRHRAIEAGEAAWRRFFERSGVEPIVVAHEALCRDYQGAARRVLARLGIAAPRELFFDERRLERP